MILLTGATGFLGKILQAKLDDQMITLGRTSENKITCDLSETIPKLPPVDLVIHAAGKAHMLPRTKADAQDFFEVNVQGTKNLLAALTAAPTRPKYFVFISSVSVYGLVSGEMINEDAPLLATDPYGRSKIEAEKLITEWCKLHLVICTIFRLPLIVGANALGNLGGMINGIQKGYYVNVAKGSARKSMVLADDVAAIIPEAASVGGIFNLTDGQHPSFIELSELITRQLQARMPKSIPFWFGVVLARFGDLFGQHAPFNSIKLEKITNTLTFDDTKAQRILGWKPNNVLDGLQVK